MSIFSRSSSTTKEAPAIPADATGAAGQPQGPADVRFAPPATPPAQTSPSSVAPRPAAPGVVPPPAAPLYSMRPADDAAESAVAEKVRLAREAQLRSKARVTAQRTTPTADTTSAVRRTPAQRLAPAPAAKQAPARQVFDPLRAAQTGLLKLAWSWQQAGAPIRAIHAYMELLFRYPDSAAADAAVADLVALSDKLASEGQFHTALAIYDHLEKWAMMEDLA